MQKIAAVPIGQYFDSPIGRDGGLAQLISNSVIAAIVGAGVVLLLFIIVGGFRMISGAGNNNPQDAAKGRQAVTGALMGFVIVFAAFWIIQLLEAITGTPFVTAPGF